MEHADKLLPLLAALTAYQASADTRRGALETLTSLALELPRHIRCWLAPVLWVHLRSMAAHGRGNIPHDRTVGISAHSAGSPARAASPEGWAWVRVQC